MKKMLVNRKKVSGGGILARTQISSHIDALRRERTGTL